MKGRRKAKSSKGVSLQVSLRFKAILQSLLATLVSCRSPHSQDVDDEIDTFRAEQFDTKKEVFKWTNERQVRKLRSSSLISTRATRSCSVVVRSCVTQPRCPGVCRDDEFGVGTSRPLDTRYKSLRDAGDQAPEVWSSVWRS